jgi:hypothetical protein
MKFLSTGTALTLALACPLDANAEISVHSGTECVRMTRTAYGGAATSSDYFDEDSLTGLVNMDRNIFMEVLCPLPFRNSKEQGAPYVAFTDLAPFGRRMIVNMVDLSPTEPVYCSMGGQSGSVRYYAPAGQSCGLFGLCDTNNPAYVTPGYYRGLDGILVPTLPDQTYVHLFLYCRLPALAAPYGWHDASGINSYRMFYNPDL